MFSVKKFQLKNICDSPFLKELGTIELVQLAKEIGLSDLTRQETRKGNILWYSIQLSRPRIICDFANFQDC